MIVKYSHPSRIGLATIVLKTGRWHIVIDGENLGSYHAPQPALDDLVGGHTESHSRCSDTSGLRLPSELADWTSHLR
jgi:hypothetical protein